MVFAYGALHITPLNKGKLLWGFLNLWPVGGMDNIPFQSTLQTPGRQAADQESRFMHGSSSNPPLAPLILISSHFLASLATVKEVHQKTYHHILLFFPLVQCSAEPSFVSLNLSLPHPSPYPTTDLGVY